VRGTSSRQVTLWPLLVALALGFFFLDVAVRKVTLPEGLRERLGRLLGRAAGARSWSYEELAAMVQRAREDERRKLRDRISGMAADGKVSSDLAAYLYIARMRSGRQGQGGAAGAGKAAPPEQKEGVSAGSAIGDVPHRIRHTYHAESGPTRTTSTEANTRRISAAPIADEPPVVTPLEVSRKGASMVPCRGCRGA